MLFAQATTGAKDRLLVILQGMDTAGKDGVLNHVFRVFNPSGLHLTAFKKPTEEELAHDFLWRVRRQVPIPGMIGVFNRSQYEDVLIVRVHRLVSEDVWEQRFSLINEFERQLVEDGVTVVKCFLHISSPVQKKRLAARLADPRKYWKFNPEDLSDRALWDQYQCAYTDALARCHTAFAPWYVIPSDRKWYRNWAVGALVSEALERMDPHYPKPTFNLRTTRRRVAAS
jgi:PPK2 family polyphosphate:nucleotide phosphotransferase